MCDYQTPECGLHCHVLSVGELVDFALGIESEELIFSSPHFAARTLFTDAYELSGDAIERGKRDQAPVQRPCGEAIILALGEYEAMLLRAVGGHEEQGGMLAFTVGNEDDGCAIGSPRR